MTTAAIHQPQYLPYLGFFHKVQHCDVLVLLDDVEFHRRGLQHRNQVKSSAGPQWLTVPVLQRSGQRIDEVTINPTDPWQRKHANAIRMNYGRAAHFGDYSGELIELIEREWTRLVDLDTALLHWVMEVLGIQKSIVKSSELKVAGTSSERLANLTTSAGADTYLSGPGGSRYMDLEVFEAAGVRVEWQEFSPPEYVQLFPEQGFVSNLSIVDPLLCCGLDTKALLE